MSDEEEIKEEYTRVTDILRPWNNFDKIPPEILENKKNIGTEVHDAIFLYNQAVPIMPLRSDVGGYFESFLLWIESSHARVMQSEERLYDDYLKITGKFDGLVKFPDEDDKVMVDWKTSATYTKDIALSWALQGTFYHYLMRKNDFRNISNRFLFIQLDPHGKLPHVREFEFSTELMGVCNAALVCYRHYHKI